MLFWHDRAVTVTFGLCVVCWIASVMIASHVAEKNDTYLAGFDGVVVDRYIGGHGMHAIRVRGEGGGASGSVEGLGNADWEHAEKGMRVVKRSGSFEITLDGKVIRLGRYARARVSEAGSEL